MNTKRFLASLLAVMTLLTGVFAAHAEEKPDSWIADRTIVLQAYVDDIGYSLPKDLASTPVMQKIQELTGIMLDVRYTPGDSDEVVLASQLAAGNIPDAIVCYLNNSTRPEFPILLKAAKEGMFADVTEYMKNSEVYSKYMEDGYLPADSYNNITFRSDLDGVYLMHFDIEAVDRSTEYIPEDQDTRGMYIQQSIVDKLGIDPQSIHTMDEFYDLLVKIKEGNFVDDNGNPVYPLGPEIWGAAPEDINGITTGFNFNPDGGYYNVDTDGHIKHEAETEWVYEKINFVRKLMAEGLINPEYFTMDATRSEEASRSKNSAIIGETSSYRDIVYASEDWVPLGRLNDRTGDHPKYVHGKGGYGAWAISAEAENPEEIFAFFDWLASYEGQLICQYGVEGLSYNMVDGYPVLTDEILEKLNNDDTDWLINNVGAGFGGQANYLFSFMVTDVDPITDFGEARPGSSNSTTYARSIELAEKYPCDLVLVPGLEVAAYLSVDEMADVKASLDLLDYNEMMAQAVFAKSDDEVKQIVESFRGQLQAAGIQKFYDYVDAVYAENPEAVRVLPVK